MSQPPHSRLGVVDQPGCEADDAGHDRQQRSAPEVGPADRASPGDQRDDTDEDGNPQQDVVPDGQSDHETEQEPQPPPPPPPPPARGGEGEFERQASRITRMRHSTSSTRTRPYARAFTP